VRLQGAKSPGTYRVVALGDSFTFDSGMVPLDRMWHTLVGERLRSRLDRPVEVINLGVSGVGPRFTARLFEIEGAALAPDLVLLGFFVGNDLTDEEPELRYRSMPERWSLLWRLIVRAPIVVRSHRRIAEAREHAQDTARRRRLPTGPGGVPIPGYVYDRDTNTFGAPDDLLRIESGRARIFATSWRPAVAARLDDVTATVATLDRAVRAAGGRLVVVVIPDVVQVDLAVREAAAGGADPAAYDFDWLQPALLARLGAAAVAAVDVLPALRAAPTSPRLYRIHDTHWSDVGNAVAAAEIVAYLEAHLPELAPHLHRALRPGRAR
jgi:lysophospholipase L1-like esterase